MTRLEGDQPAGKQSAVHPTDRQTDRQTDNLEGSRMNKHLFLHSRYVYSYIFHLFSDVIPIHGKEGRGGGK